MFHFSSYFSEEDIKRICERMSLSVNEGSHLSPFGQRIMKSVHFTESDLEKIVAKLAKEQVRDELMLNIYAELVKGDYQRKLDAKKTLRAWGRDIVTAFIAGLGVILAVGLLFNGYVRFAAINATAEKAVGIDLDAQKRMAPVRK
ncbi:hypothetical protein Jab_1c05940 [Janthinobacterium sp. HH01]|nr:hypothetical protein Jab_1c05940 [Janthinobacterium sp. HH01]